jgi:membrane associated rhomboid family serine protease
VIPIRDDNPHFLTPVVTYGIIGLNLAAWLLLQGMGTEPRLSSSVCSLGAIPGELLQTVAAGTSFQLSTQTMCVTGPAPVWSTLVSSMFLHGGWLHLLGNMWFMWIFGNNVEDSMGRGRFVAFYLICGLVAAGSQVLSSPTSTTPIVGASGAIGGVMGAYIILYPRVHVHMLIFLGFFVTTVAVPAFWMLGYWLLLQLIGGYGAITGEKTAVAFWAHLGGFLAGMLLIPLFRNPRLLARHPFHGWKRQELPSRSWQRVRR